MTTKAILFHSGPIVATPGAMEALQRNQVSATDYLARHFTGDWGELDDEDKQSNNEAVDNGSRILSAYFLPDETKIWIITDAEIDEKHHRQATTLLLPDEY